MAQPSYRFQINSLRPREKMKLMANDTRAHIQHGFEVQKVYPLGEVYPGWYEENYKRQQGEHSGWYSTGDAARSFYWQLRYIDGIDDFPSEVHMEYFFNYYLSFVDYGVGKNRPLSKVQRSEDARRNTRYVDMWAPKQGKTHRPIFRKEMRHLRSRAGLWLTTWSGRLYYEYVWNGLEGLTHITDENKVHGGFVFGNVRTGNN